MIEIKNLKKSWSDGITVLDNINLTIEDGDIYALVGRSGAGKSTLLRCINGLAGYDSGHIFLDGKEVKDLTYKEMREVRRRVGMVLQNFSLLERRTVYENVALPMKCWGYSNEKIRKKVTDLLELVGLADKAAVRPRSLSGGQKQRVAIARALTMEPKLLLSDEATSALDPNTSSSVLNLLQQINVKTGITVIVVTHQMEVVRQICNKACILESGKIAAEGSVKSIFIKRPNALKRLLGEEEERYDAADGNIIQIAYEVTDDTLNLLADIARTLDIFFKTLGGGIETFSSDRLAVFRLGITDRDRERVAAYLENKNCIWHYLKTEASEKERVI